MSEVSHVQWFPGHMAKTRRIMASNLKLVDAVVEITDARIPFSSRNPEMKRIVGSKPRLVLLNKRLGEHQKGFYLYSRCIPSIYLSVFNYILYTGKMARLGLFGL